MIRFLGLILLVFPTIAFAKKEIPKKPARSVAQVESETPAAKSLLKFLSCRVEMLNAKDDTWLQCLDPVTVTSPARKKQFAEFLFNPYDYKKIRNCTAVELAKGKLFPEARDLAVCFEYEDQGKSQVGVAYFVSVGGSPKLFSLHRID